MAETAATTLADEGRLDGPTPPLSAAPDVLILDDIAGILIGLTGHTLRRVVTDDSVGAVFTATT